MNRELKHVYSKLNKVMPKGRVFKDENMAQHTSYKIGGDAKVFVEIKTLEDVILALDVLNSSKVKYFVLGKGTNTLFDDNGYDGVVLHISKDFSNMYRKGNKIVCASGASLNSLCNYACEHGLSGLEYAYGIPGSVGGAVYMNASAFDYMTSNVVTSVLAVIDGKVTLIKKEDCNFSYKHSIFMEKPNSIILQAEFALKKGNKKEIMNTMLNVMATRKERQPLDFPSCGCVFKQHKDINVSKTIDEDGLKGYTIGGAQISTKHASFIINLGNATSADILAVAEYVKKHFLNKYNIQLDYEVIHVK